MKELELTIGQYGSGNTKIRRFTGSELSDVRYLQLSNKEIGDLASAINMAIIMAKRTQRESTKLIQAFKEIKKKIVKLI